MEFEVPLLIELGYEVFVPKLIPQNNFRSATINFDYDSSLSIPQHVIDYLNSVDFYLNPWNPKTIRLVNRYFGTVFVMPYREGFQSPLLRFEGDIYFRAFGLDSPRTYTSLIEEMFGKRALATIVALRNRFYFAAGYSVLKEVEAQVLQNRNVFLPIGVGKPFWDLLDSAYESSNIDVLFLCSNRLSSPYYAKQFQTFKSIIGMNSHLVVDNEDPAGSDSHILHKISWEKLITTYRTSKIFLTPSEEPRHTLYSPIEAMIIGIPVVLSKYSLLGRMANPSTPGLFSDSKEATELVNRFLAMPDSERYEVVKAQRFIANQFSFDYCLNQWKNQFGIYKSPTLSSLLKSVLQECSRFIFAPISSGQWHPFYSTMLTRKINKVIQEQTTKGDLLLPSTFTVDFRENSEYLLSISGLSSQESFGRWTDGKRAEITLISKLPRFFHIDLDAFTVGIGESSIFKIKVGNSSKFFTVANTPTLTRVDFFNFFRNNLIEIQIPNPTALETDSRELGIAISNLTIHKKNWKEVLEYFAQTIRNLWS